MAKPPPDINSFAKGPSPLSRLVGDGQRPITIIEFPGERGAGHSIGIWALYDGETRAARMDAIKYLFDTLKLTELHLAYEPSIGEEEGKTQILYRALRDPVNPIRPFAASPEQLRESISPDEREALFSAYLEFVDERSPIKRLKDEKEVDELISALGKAATQRITLSSYDTVSLRRIVLSLVDRLKTPTSASFSDTSQQSDSSGLSAIPASE